jgi:hypothetical protein
MSEALTLSKNLLGDLLPESSISQEGLQKIVDRLPELHRGKRAIGRKNSQTTATLMTMTILADSPYRQMKQCLSQISNKRAALIESHFTVKKNLVKIKRWKEESDELSDIQAEEALVQNEEMKSGVENSLKEIGMYQDIYEQIRTSHGIPVDWDEVDYEKQEIEHALRMAFRHAIQNIMSSGKIAISTVEYWEQFGVHPMVGEKLTREYLSSVQKELSENKHPSVVSMHQFLDRMVETFKEEHKHSLTRIGVDAIVNHQYAYKNRSNGNGS